MVRPCHHIVRTPGHPVRTLIALRCARGRHIELEAMCHRMREMIDPLLAANPEAWFIMVADEVGLPACDKRLMLLALCRWRRRWWELAARSAT